MRLCDTPSIFVIKILDINKSGLSPPCPRVSEESSHLLPRTSSFTIFFSWHASFTRLITTVLLFSLLLAGSETFLFVRPVDVCPSISLAPAFLDRLLPRSLSRLNRTSKKATKERQGQVQPFWDGLRMELSGNSLELRTKFCHFCGEEFEPRENHETHYVTRLSLRPLPPRPLPRRLPASPAPHFRFPFPLLTCALPTSENADSRHWAQRTLYLEPLILHERCILQSKEAIVHCGQVFCLLQLLTSDCRPSWWAAARYRATLVLWADCRERLDPNISDDSCKNSGSPSSPKTVAIDNFVPTNASALASLWRDDLVPIQT